MGDISTAPQRIWLQNTYDEDGSMPFPDWPHDVVTWSDTPFGGTEVEYVRSDLVRAVMPANWKEDEDWVRLVMAMGGDDDALTG